MVAVRVNTILLCDFDTCDIPVTMFLAVVLNVVLILLPTPGGSGSTSRAVR